ncbi:uncharacterized protein METZ01_LOCUS158630 [marine metagenome]|uniref:Uncharacterized protein n=1 Tax=marine metagenome TaxID=408172 RepID=A0A382AW57_9ZZZZ|tara:strand:+ start:376 stop:552 length:177 start_codon:yes stop_codon:yes gene_type:complete
MKPAVNATNTLYGLNMTVWVDANESVTPYEFNIDAAEYFAEVSEEIYMIAEPMRQGLF